ncbi:hypothetical protein SDC9_86466 [bioreactor metagenome]|uniref:Uncharacterized protein n=1 Tax=bioreactor metagenome TaxID=1076179 RepID=A0A644ZG54_9ZZZZ
MLLIRRICYQRAGRRNGGIGRKLAVHRPFDCARRQDQPCADILHAVGRARSAAQFGYGGKRLNVVCKRSHSDLDARALAAAVVRRCGDDRRSDLQRLDKAVAVHRCDQRRAGFPGHLAIRRVRPGQRGELQLEVFRRPVDVDRQRCARHRRIVLLNDNRRRKRLNRHFVEGARSPFIQRNRLKGNRRFFCDGLCGQKSRRAKGRVGVVFRREIPFHRFTGGFGFCKLNRQLRLSARIENSAGRIDDGDACRKRRNLNFHARALAAAIVRLRRERQQFCLARNRRDGHASVVIVRQGRRVSTVERPGDIRHPVRRSNRAGKFQGILRIAIEHNCFSSDIRYAVCLIIHLDLYGGDRRIDDNLLLRHICHTVRRAGNYGNGVLLRHRLCEDKTARAHAGKVGITGRQTPNNFGICHIRGNEAARQLERLARNHAIRAVDHDGVFHNVHRHLSVDAGVVQSRRPDDHIAFVIPGQLTGFLINRRIRAAG